MFSRLCLMFFLILMECEFRWMVCILNSTEGGGVFSSYENLGWLEDDLYLIESRCC